MPMSSSRSRTAIRCCAIPAAMLTIAVSVRAQSLSSFVDVGLVSGSAFAGPAASALLLQPSIRWDHPSASVDAQASWLAGAGARMDGDASIRGHYFSPVYEHLRVELSAAAERTAGADVIESSNALQGDVDLSYSFGSGGVWVSGGQRVTAAHLLPSQVRSFGAGSWRRFGGVVFTASFTTSGSGTGRFGGASPGGALNDTLGSVVDTGSRTSSVLWQYADLESTVYWSRGALALNGLLGTRVSNSYGARATWGRAQASWALGEQLALVAAGGTRASEPSVGRVGGNFFSFGVRLASAPWISHTLHGGARSTASTFGVRADGAARVIYVHAPAARTIELMADFTDWQPVLMRHTGTDEWELAMRIAPGSHCLNIRVDGGEWSAPPGAGTVQDEFNGVVGLVVVP